MQLRVAALATILIGKDITKYSKDLVCPALYV